MKAIQKFLLENSSPLEVLGLTKCPHCQCTLTRSMITTRELNGTYYYYHLNCGDSRPIGSMPTNNNSMLRDLWTSHKSCTNPVGSQDYYTNKK